MIHSPRPQSRPSDCRLILEILGRTDTQCENSDHYRPGLWSASWINKQLWVVVGQSSGSQIYTWPFPSIPGCPRRP